MEHDAIHLSVDGRNESCMAPPVASVEYDAVAECIARMALRHEEK